MKFQFESDLDFQTRAVAAVVDLFRKRSAENRKRAKEAAVGEAAK